MRYRSEIDGLRALAVVPVILFHAGVTWLSGGFAGVDVFFVISGFLIISIIVGELETGSFSMMRFYERRARRILPALFLVVACCLPFAVLWLLPVDMDAFMKSVVAVATFTSNIYFWLGANYFDTSGQLKPLLHTWSLGVEEQFYILFPLIMAVTWRFGERIVIAMLVVAFLASLALAEWAAHRHVEFAFYLLPARAWELALGALVAFCVRGDWLPDRRPVAEVGGLLGIALIAYAMIGLSQADHFPGLHALIPTMGAALVILFAVEGTLAQRLLSARPLVWIGLVSYSAYLWHQPLFAFARHASLIEPAPYIMPLMVVCTFVLAGLTRRYVEQPFRRRDLIPARRVFAFAGAGSAALIGIGAMGAANHLLLSQPALARTAILDYRYDNHTMENESWTLLRGVTHSPRYTLADNPADRRPWFSPGDPRAKLLIVGNSHSKDMYNVLAYSRTARRSLQIARFGGQIGLLKQPFFAIPNYRQADVVLITSRYGPSDIGAFAPVIERIMHDGKVAAIARNETEFSEYKEETLNRADVQVLTAMRQGKVDGDTIKRLSDRAYYTEFATLPRDELMRKSDAEITRLRQRFPNLIVLDRMDYVCSREQQACFSIDPGLGKFFYDYGHNTLRGARFFGARVDAVDWLAPIETALAARAAGASAGDRPDARIR